MTEIPTIASMRPEPERNRWGHYVLPDVNGVKRGWTRATTVAHSISDEYGLSQWKRRMVLQGLAQRRDLLDLVEPVVGELEHPDYQARKDAKAALDSMCDDAAAAAGADRGSKLGTLLHTITEYADAGRLDEIQHLVPAALTDDLAAYVRALAEANVERPAEFIERIVVNERVDAAGTLDRLVRIDGGPLIIGDLKTQKSLDFGFMEIAIQLAQYANAEWIWNPDTEQLDPMPPVNKEIGLIFHLPVGSKTCVIYEVDLVAGWRAAELAYEVRETRKQSKAMGWRYVPRPAASDRPAGADDHVLYLIRSATHPDALAGIWRDRVGKGEPWTPEMNAAAAARKAELTDPAGTAQATAAA